MLPSNNLNFPNAPNPSKRAKPALGAAKLGAVASQVFLSGSWNCQPSKPLETCQAAALNWSCQTKGSGKPSLSFRLLELPNYGLWQAKWYFSVAKLEAVASQVFLFLLARNCQMLLSNALNPPNRPNPSKRAAKQGRWQAKSFFPALGTAKLRALASQVVFFGCQTRGCGRPSLSFPTGPKLPDAAFKRFKPSKPSKPLETCQTAPLGAATLRAVASQVFLSGSWDCQTTGSGKPSCFFGCQKRGCGRPSLSFPARSCRMLPSNASNTPNPPNPSKRAKPRLLELPN